MELIREKWNEIKTTIKNEYSLTDISYHTWIEPLKLLNVENNVVSIIIPSDQSQAFNYISNKFKSFFQVTITEMFENDYDIKFVLDGKNNSFNNEENTSQSQTSFNHIEYEKTGLNRKYSFNNFVVGSNNRMAQSASLATAEAPGEVYNPLYIYGGPGLGKTHLMHSIGNYIIENNPDLKVLYVTSEVFTNEVIDSIRSGNAASMTALREKYRTVDVLMVDDIQFIIGKASTQEEFFNTFNALFGINKQIVISSDRPPKELKELDERFISRFLMGLIVDISQPDYETRMAILKKYEETNNTNLSEDILQYIAENIKSNVRELEGAFNKIIAFAKLSKIDNLTLESAEEALKDMIYPDQPKEITSEKILNVIADHFGVTPDDITSKKRNQEFVLPRQIFMYLCHEMINGISYSQIAKILGKKDHTTVLYGFKKISEDVKANDEIANKVDVIRKKILS